ncbi:hypothetical protein SAMN05444287_1916 [Octadecabacter temperatus]|jgi:hypothetical protein|uniref:Uncharacterized protein n=1 Tax=Octadecabacter temperatus TaxID=1458307 RepID=A0A0K0Y755_9RHOB|nr:hypothetical protein [Octadecabacter temperatus]AKS46793.1 hypothetical protein OSB_22560 [Octadecabacter temperatus]SIO21332.1 hypothetical protein SAMN05444287_1916 [Octadecabacter temperatus]
MRFALALFALLAALPSCTEFPELDSTVSSEVANAPYPELVPLAPLLAQANTSTGAAEIANTNIDSRLSNLRARAARLRGPVIPAAIRARMLRGVR